MIPKPGVTPADPLGRVGPPSVTTRGIAMGWPFASATVFLASHLGRGVTGNVLYVDAGYQIMGL